LVVIEIKFKQGKNPYPYQNNTTKMVVIQHEKVQIYDNKKERREKKVYLYKRVV